MFVAAPFLVLVLLAPFSQGSRTIENLHQVRGKLILHVAARGGFAPDINQGSCNKNTFHPKATK